MEPLHGASKPWLDPQGRDAGTQEQPWPGEHQHQCALRWPDRTVVHRKADKITSAEMIALFKQLEALYL